jgi:hypothetical protein
MDQSQVEQLVAYITIPGYKSFGLRNQCFGFAMACPKHLSPGYSVILVGGIPLKNMNRQLG